MQSAPQHPQESKRIAELARLDVLDTEDEEALDELTELASSICGTPISLISLIDTDRQWFKSRVGLDAHETPREFAFCAHAILQPDLFEVTNALEDERFHDNPLVSSDPNIRFYAGEPLVTDNGMPIGTLCVIDQKPKKLTQEQKRALKILAKQVVGQLELRINYKKLKRVDLEREKIFSVIAHDLRSPFNGILGLSKILNEKAATIERKTIQMMSEKILESSLQVFQIIDELMQWTQQRLGRNQIKISPCNLALMVKETIDLLADALKLKGLTYNVQVGDSVEVLADAAIIKMILRNLISNAIKYSNANESIDIDATIQASEIIVSVTDKGQGVSSEVMNSLFKESVDSQSDTQGLKGTGIGLSLCAELIVTQNGKIWVDKNYTQGARIQFSLPLA
ncbi:GAF domain-containing sensor histidine kinase [Bermanella sp. WJH001]|uniref:GAF domain-containing sensor histidine kinase n=1 Tax=Bermanella sp. WJH001 TaxID=3048005 RepID=UPI0024BE2E35|nr:GAF domain-containing sensor histidine kinase [Bermanella sp. WJH001]MDJ1539243.1 GAF domain-containing sensor histidine kinase [Bermanella sp. WJH001]